MDRLGLNTRRLGHPLGGAAGRSAEQKFHALGREDSKDRIDDRRFADARAAGDHEGLRNQRQADRVPLTVGELQAAALFDPRNRLLRVNPSPGQRTVHDANQPIGYSLLGPNRPARNVQAVSPTLSAITLPSDSSSSRAVRIKSFGASSNSSASGIK